MEERDHQPGVREFWMVEREQAAEEVQLVPSKSVGMPVRLVVEAELLIDRAGRFSNAE
jgi:hypothetical protein